MCTVQRTVHFREQCTCVHCAVQCTLSTCTKPVPVWRSIRALGGAGPRLAQSLLAWWAASHMGAKRDAEGGAGGPSRTRGGPPAQAPQCSDYRQVVPGGRDQELAILSSPMRLSCLLLLRLQDVALHAVLLALAAYTLHLAVTAMTAMDQVNINTSLLPPLYFLNHRPKCLLNSHPRIPGGLTSALTSDVTSVVTP